MLDYYFIQRSVNNFAVQASTLDNHDRFFLSGRSNILVLR